MHAIDPLVENALCYTGAAEALEAFRARLLSPVELLDALIERAEAVEPTLNAFSATYFDEARKKARHAEQRYSARSGRARALEGICLAVKADSESAIQGTVSSDGALWRVDAVDDLTSPSIGRLIDAGAIVIGRTTMPEFGWTWTCDSIAHGVTPNPWNPKYSAGGSSAGSASAVAAGMTTIATGTDCIGSLRQPSAMCGVVGYKPPYGRNPLIAEHSLDFFSHIGPMARSVADCVLAQNIMSGPHPLDHASLPTKVTIPWPQHGVAGVKIAYSPDLGCFPVSSDVRRETEAAVRALVDAGAEVTTVAIDWARDIVAAASKYVDCLYGPEFAAAVRDFSDQICDYTRHFAEFAQSVDPSHQQATLMMAGETWRDHFGPLFQIYDALICPTLAFHHVPARNRPWDRNIEVDGRLYTDHDAVMTSLFSVYSRCPALVVPSGFTDQHMPTSLQIVARPYDDVTAFRIGAALESRRPFLNSPALRPQL